MVLFPFVICFLIEIEQSESILTLIPTVVILSQPQQLQKWTGCSRWVVFSSHCIYLHSWMLEILIQCRSQASSCLVSPIVCSCSFQLLLCTDSGQPTQLRTLKALQFSLLAKLHCCLQITDRQLTLWYSQCSNISHFNFSGCWKDVYLSCFPFPLQLSVQNAQYNILFLCNFIEKSWEKEWVVKET